MKSFLTSLSLLICSGCQTFPDERWVENHRAKSKKLLFVKKPPEFKEIYHRKYKIHDYDCSNKCAEYVSHLHANGIFSQILSVDYDGPNVTKLIWSERLGKYAIERHAIVRIFQNGKFLYADPTSFKWSRDICDFTPGCFGGITGVTNLEDFLGNEFDF